MQIKNIGFVLISENVPEASKYYEQNFGFNVIAQIGWYASHEHPDHKGVFLDILKKDHESLGASLLGKQTTGVIVALVVDDVDAEYERLKDTVHIIMKPQSEPWGQRRLQILGPDSVIIELIQLIEMDKEWLAANT